MLVNASFEVEIGSDVVKLSVVRIRVGEVVVILEMVVVVVVGTMLEIKILKKIFKIFFVLVKLNL